MDLVGDVTADHQLDSAAERHRLPANATGDDVAVFGDASRQKPIATLHTLRQQLSRREGRANVALADFVAPRESGVADYVGAFAVTAGHGVDELVRRGALRSGLTWHYARPPVVDLEYEMDCRRVMREVVI